MDRHDDIERDPDFEDTTLGSGETHATTGGAAVAGAVTGGVIGLTSGPLGAAIGAVTGAIVGVAAERMMHSDDDAERAREAAHELRPGAEDITTDDDITAERDAA